MMAVTLVGERVSDRIAHERRFTSVEAEA